MSKWQQEAKEQGRGRIGHMLPLQQAELRQDLQRRDTEKQAQQDFLDRQAQMRSQQQRRTERENRYYGVMLFISSTVFWLGLVFALEWPWLAPVALCLYMVIAFSHYWRYPQFFELGATTSQLLSGFLIYAMVEIAYSFHHQISIQAHIEQIILIYTQAIEHFIQWLQDLRG